MTDSEIFNLLFNGGNITLPYLIKFSSKKGSIYLVNNNENIAYAGNTYSASTFEYTRPNNKGEGGSLSITAIDNSLFELVENSDSSFNLNVIGVLASSGEIQKLKQYKHFYGSVSCSEDMKLEFQLGKDDRLEMQFPTYKFDTDNNPANA